MLLKSLRHKSLKTPIKHFSEISRLEIPESYERVPTDDIFLLENHLGYTKNLNLKINTPIYIGISSLCKIPTNFLSKIYGVKCNSLNKRIFNKLINVHELKLDTSNGEHDTISGINVHVMYIIAYSYHILKNLNIKILIIFLIEEYHEHDGNYIFHTYYKINKFNLKEYDTYYEEYLSNFHYHKERYLHKFYYP